MAPDQLYARARRSYERARWTVGARLATPALAVVALSLLVHGLAAWCLCAGSALCALVALCGWRGGAWADVAMPALLAGLVPFIAPLATRSFGHACVGDVCVSYCLLACGVGGFLAGFLFAARARPRGSSWTMGALILALTGSLGCAFAGAPGVLGLLAGGFIGAVPAALWARGPQAASRG